MTPSHEQSDRSPHIEREPALIASLGRIYRHKGHERVIAALPHIAAQRPDARLLIAGHPEREYDASLRQLADHFGVSDRVEIDATDPDRQQMIEMLWRTRVFVSMSEYEPQGIVVREALRAGCRAVVARSPVALTELADAGLARGVPLDSSPEELADVIVEELDKPLPEPPTVPT
jgi:glycosyltransferase involved in cell wall biosynthesis